MCGGQDRVKLGPQVCRETKTHNVSKHIFTHSPISPKGLYGCIFKIKFGIKVPLVDVINKFRVICSTVSTLQIVKITPPIPQKLTLLLLTVLCL